MNRLHKALIAFALSVSATNAYAVMEVPEPGMLPLIGLGVAALLAARLTRR